MPTGIKRTPITDLYILDNGNNVRRLDLGAVIQGTDEDLPAALSDALEQAQKKGFRLFCCTDSGQVVPWQDKNAAGKSVESAMPVEPARPPHYPPRKPAEPRKPDGYWYKSWLPLFRSWRQEVRQYRSEKAAMDDYNQRKTDYKKYFDSLQGEDRAGYQKVVDDYRKAAAKYKDRMAALEIIRNTPQTISAVEPEELEQLLHRGTADFSDIDRYADCDRNLAEFEEMKPEIARRSREMGETLSEIRNARSDLDPEGGWDALTSELSDSDASRGKTNEFSLGRTAGKNLCVAVLMEEGYELKDILDPHQLADEKKQAVDRVCSELKAGNLNWIVDKLYKGMQKSSQRVEEIFGRMVQPGYSLEDLCRDGRDLYCMGNMAHDLNQEIDRAFAKQAFLQAGFASDQELSDAQNRANMCGCLVTGIVDGLKEEKYLYDYALMEREKPCFGDAWKVFLAQDIRENLLPQIYGGPDRGRNIPPAKYEEYNTTALMHSGFINASAPIRNMTGLMVGEGKGLSMRLTQAVHIPMAMAICKGTLPRVTGVDISTGEVTVEDLSALTRSTENMKPGMQSLMRVARAQSRAKQAEQAEQEIAPVVQANVPKAAQTEAVVSQTGPVLGGF